MAATVPSQMLRAVDVAERLGLASKTVRDLARRGELPALRFGPRGHWLFDPAAIELVVSRGTSLRDPKVDVARVSAFSAQKAWPDPATTDEGER